MTAVSVFPLDFHARATGFIYANFSWCLSVSGEFPLGRLRAPCLFLGDKADSFVTHLF
jgi:hypothetical protein